MPDRNSSPGTQAPTEATATQHERRQYARPTRTRVMRLRRTSGKTATAPVEGTNPYNLTSQAPS